MLEYINNQAPELMAMFGTLTAPCLVRVYLILRQLHKAQAEGKPHVWHKHGVLKANLFLLLFSLLLLVGIGIYGCIQHQSMLPFILVTLCVSFFGNLPIFADLCQNCTSSTSYVERGISKVCPLQTV